MNKLKPVCHRAHSDRRLYQSLPTLPNEESPKSKKAGMAMSVEQMADELAIGRNIAYQLIRQPDFPAFMIGRRVLISRKGLQIWIDEQCKRNTFSPDYEESQLNETIEK